MNRYALAVPLVATPLLPSPWSRARTPALTDPLGVRDNRSDLRRGDS